MRALTVDGSGVLSFQEFPVPEYGACQALVKMRSCGVQRNRYKTDPSHI